MTIRIAFALALALASLPAAAAEPAKPAAAPAHAAASGSEADHAALRQLKADLQAAINSRDFEKARGLVHDPVLATPVTQESFNRFDDLVAYFKSLFTRDTLRMKSVKLTAEADELSQIYTGTFALTRGSTREAYELEDGRGFELKGRWTATSIKEPDGSWKLLAIHSGTNFLDNPVLAAIEKSVVWAGAGAGVLGLLIGFILGRWNARRRAAAPAS